MDKQTKKPERVVSVDDLSRSKEFSSEELQGVVNLSLNQYIQDYVSLEIQRRALRELADSLRGKDKVEEAEGKIAEVIQKKDNIERQIKHHRQVRDELGRGIFIV